MWRILDRLRIEVVALRVNQIETKIPKMAVFEKINSFVKGVEKPLDLSISSVSLSLSLSLFLSLSLSLLV